MKQQSFTPSSIARFFDKLKEVFIRYGLNVLRAVVHRLRERGIWPFCTKTEAEVCTEV